MTTYKYVIVGSGPTGLTLAWCLSQLITINEKIIVIERDGVIGGCNKVTRVDGLFSEHGPRIYASNYVNTCMLLRDMGFSFRNLFTKYNASFIGSGITTVWSLKSWELKAFIKAYINLFFNNKYGLDQSVLKFMKNNNFTLKTKDLIDRLCRLTDGAGAERYTLHEFLQLLNQNAFYDAYQPKKPNDIGLFQLWEQKLLNTGKIDIVLNTNVTKIIDGFDINHGSIVTNKGIIHGEHVLLAIPPRPLMKIQVNSSKDLFGDMTHWVKESEYLLYIPITFHWDIKLNLIKINSSGLTETVWGLVTIVLSDYMEFTDPRSKTVISLAISKPNSVSNAINKTPHQCDEDELISEVFRQLVRVYGNMSEPTAAVLSPHVYKKNSKWLSRDTAFVLTPAGYGPTKSHVYNNLYTVGTHNGNSRFSFTSMESAVTNALHMVHKLVPQSRYKYPIKEPIALICVAKVLLVFIILFVLIFVICRFVDTPICSHIIQRHSK